VAANRRNATEPHSALPRSRMRKCARGYEARECLCEIEWGQEKETEKEKKKKKEEKKEKEKKSKHVPDSGAHHTTPVGVQRSAVVLVPVPVLATAQVLTVKTASMSWGDGTHHDTPLG
jgi:hypothetical protein